MLPMWTYIVQVVHESYEPVSHWFLVWELLRLFFIVGVYFIDFAPLHHHLISTSSPSTDLWMEDWLQNPWCLVLYRMEDLEENENSQFLCFSTSLWLIKGVFLMGLDNTVNEKYGGLFELVINSQIDWDDWHCTNCWGYVWMLLVEKLDLVNFDIQTFAI